MTKSPKRCPSPRPKPKPDPQPKPTGSTGSTSVTIVNNLAIDIDPASPLSNAETAGENVSPPMTIDARSTGSGGIFKGGNGITAVIAYSTSDPRYLWVLFFNSPPNGTQTVKTAFFPTGTMIDQNLVKDVMGSAGVGANASHSYTTGGVPVTLDSRGTAGRGTSPSPTFQINYRT